MDVENPMVNDNLWSELTRLTDEEWYEKADQMYEDECERRAYDAWLAQMEDGDEEDESLSFYAWSREQDGYHF